MADILALTTKLVVAYLRNTPRRVGPSLSAVTLVEAWEVSNVGAG